MEYKTSSENHLAGIGQHLFPAAGPVLLIAIGYIDPGKWAAVVDGGARFGFDLLFPVLMFNVAAILCQYLSARVALVTGRDLAKICSEEYDKITCILLGVQSEVSTIALDLMMVLGTAHGLNVLFGIDLFTAVFLTALNAFLFPLIATFIEDSKVKFVSIYISIVIILFYVFGVFISQPGSPPLMDGGMTRLSGESSFALMSLLGATIMPHNFYLHSAIIQQDQRPTSVTKDALCHGHFFAILCIFSVIFLVNCVLMSSAASAFYGSGLVLLTFQDVLSLMDQVFRSSIGALCLILLMFLSSQVTAFTWNIARQAVVHDLLKLDIPGWLHHATVRIIATIPALYCVWNSGAEGIYQLLVFSQVVVSLMLPSSVIPLFRVATSRALMGVYKVSQFEEFLALITFIGMLGLKIMFFVELLFGNSDWVSNLRWNRGSGLPIAYVILLVAASVSFSLALWLTATPLKSATSRIDAQVLDWDVKSAVGDALIERQQDEACVSEYQLGKPADKLEPAVTFENSLVSHSEFSTSGSNLNLPETLFESENVIHPRILEDNQSDKMLSSALHAQESLAVEDDVSLVKSQHSEVSDGEKPNAQALKNELKDPEEKTDTIEGEVESVKDENDTWESEELSLEIIESNQSLKYDGPGSFRSLSGKSDDVGSGTGSLSRLNGLGRAARRQFAAILDEFWGQMFDFHGQATQEARAKKVDVLLGLEVKMDSKAPSPSVKMDSRRQDFTGYHPSLSTQGSDSLMNSSVYSSPRQQIGQGMMDPCFAGQRVPSPSWSSSHAQLLGAYVRNSSRSVLDSGERRYSSMHIPASSDVYDQQSATIHGYELASYYNQIAKERGSGFSTGQNEFAAPKSLSSAPSHFRDSVSRPLVKNPQNGMSTLTPPGFHNVSVSRNNSLQPERSSYGIASPIPAESINSPVNEKKFYSMPDISSLRVPYRDSSLLDKSKWENPVKYGQSVGGPTYDRIPQNTSSRPEVPPGFSVSSPKVCRDAFSLLMNSSSRSGSLWSRQPYEQFGVADKSHTEGEQIKASYAQEAPSAIDMEVRILQSFRHSIMKLLKLEGSDWLFRQNDGADEDLIDRVAAREKYLHEAESVQQMNWPNNTGEAQFFSERKPEADSTKLAVTSVPHCGEGCVYKTDLIISFGVWCIHRVLELSLMESRPELWGKYTYVLNRLQGIIDPAFFRSRSIMTPCFCLQLPAGWQQKSSPPISNGSLPPQAKQGRGKCTTAASLLDIIKDVELAISCRKGRTGTAAGDVAFPKGKENLASVLKRYKRRFSNKLVGSQDGSRRAPSSAQYVL